MNLALFPLILFGTLLNTGAQLLLKAGMNYIGQFEFSFQKLMAVGFKVAINPYILIGLFFYVVSVVVWLMVLSRTEVSVAYPMVSLGYILNAISAYYIFGESLSLPRILGILIILLGVCIVARS